jgi:hypothetical protein
MKVNKEKEVNMTMSSYNTDIYAAYSLNF